MKKHILYFFLFVILQSCRKENSCPENLTSTKHFSMVTDVKNLTNVRKNKLNDSLAEIKGVFGKYEIDGYLKNDNEKIGWWKISDIKNKYIIAKLEYRTIDKKEFVNQYILFKKLQLDTSNSKFYNRSIALDTVEYVFYIPNNFQKLQSRSKFNYHLYVDGKEATHSQSEGKNEKNYYYCKVPIPSKGKIMIRGNFWEMFQIKNGDIGENEIYVLDTISR